MIAVTFALPSESSAFLRLLQNPRRGASGAHTVSGTLHGRAVCVLHTGVGERSTRERLASFLREQTPQLLISSGFAGALNKQLRVGDILLAEKFSSARMQITDQVRTIPGKLATVPAMIDSLAQRDELARRTGADAVDMETEFIANVCAAAKIPMLSLRAISDSPAAPFPAPPEILFNVNRQRTEISALLLYLLRHPGAIPRLMIFAKQATLARRSLANTLDRLFAGDLGL